MHIPGPPSATDRRQLNLPLGQSRPGGFVYPIEERHMEMTIEELMESMPPATDTPADVVTPIEFPYEEVTR